jgi:peptidoglycan L-alanyl-D-glutamate endopeptidase CwlK
MKLSERSLRRLEGVHPDLVEVVHHAAELATKAGMDFGVGEGMRSLARQKQLVTEGKSKTLNSRHLTGHAVDLWVYKDGIVTWAQKEYLALSKIILQAAKDRGIPLRWGGDWDGDGDSKDERFFDGPHYELPAKYYPAKGS